ncbi:uncharacterized protein LOC112527153 isoform X1 [Cynara cardunculus var. scolymus]|uniref:uncharacterized protein LOC112527153 isoform X1 n=1 Tax=Cynara cardunculus var. scolymus TaxID=59895 RepID=UPI000D62811B|nr:uncharacterized protein LOC112527153 isoform X1 [Cynara cardunculus var. scolymus]XP_024993373.1 uncharacterized protein LOC112527153 isoform X1 [Cynara cardunculus var. scolymus]
MGDHFVFLVDRLLTESTLEAAIESRNPSKQLDPLGNAETVVDCSSDHVVFTPRKLVECRICQDEDFDLNMETPCSCCGSLKYAHRRCVQRWCNEKGDTMCEICHQQFKPGYTAPSPVFRLGGIPLNLRGHWQIARRDMNNNPRLIAVVSPDRSFLNQEYDEYADSTSRSVSCFRSVAAIFVVLLFLRHALPVVANGGVNYSFPMFMLWFLRTSAVIVPIYVIMRAMMALMHRRRQLVSNSVFLFFQMMSILIVEQPVRLTLLIHEPKVTGSSHRTWTAF